MSLRIRGLALSPLAALALPLSFALVACGGKLDDKAFQNCPATESCADTGPIGDAADTGDDADTGDALPDTYPDAPPGCGSGPCSPGYSCTLDACTQAYCFGDNAWEFSNTCVPDTPPPCPASQPYNGQGCYAEGQSCGYSSTCGTVYATCSGGAWSVPIIDCPPPPPGCPTFEPPSGTGCSAGGEKCSWPNTCGSTDTGYCDPSTARWTLYPGTCSGTCPASEPANGSACSGSATCKWMSACGGTDYGACSAGRWNLSVGPCPAPTCPVAEPAQGSPCVATGVGCGWTNACGGYDTAYCAPSGWRITYGSCTTKCPASEPAPGAYCPSAGASCSWPNSCGGTDTGYCNGSNAGQPTGGSCPAPVCPATTPKAGGACVNGLSCEYSNGCGGVDYWSCSGGTWFTKGPSYCPPGCPSGKPTTGSSCKAVPGGASCNYVTDPAGQCTSSCFCSDIGSWACTTPTCSGPVPPPFADGGVPIYDAGVGDAGFGPEAY